MKWPTRKELTFKELVPGIMVVQEKYNDRINYLYCQAQDTEGVRNGYIDFYNLGGIYGISRVTPSLIQKDLLHELQQEVKIETILKGLDHWQEAGQAHKKNKNTNQWKGNRLVLASLPLTFENAHLVENENYQVVLVNESMIFDLSHNCLVMDNMFSFNEELKEHPDYPLFYDYLIANIEKTEGTGYVDKVREGDDYTLRQYLAPLKEDKHYLMGGVAFSHTISSSHFQQAFEIMAELDINIQDYIIANQNYHVSLPSRIAFSLQHPEFVSLMFDQGMITDPHYPDHFSASKQELEAQNFLAGQYLKAYFLNNSLQKNLSVKEVPRSAKKI